MKNTHQPITKLFPNDHYAKMEIDILTKMIIKFPMTASNYARRAEQYYYCKDYQRALVDFTKAIELDCSNKAYYYNRGLTNKEIGNQINALADFNSAVSLGLEKAKDQICTI